MARGRNPLKERTYILKTDRELATDQQSKFIYRTLPYETYTRTQDALIEFRGNPQSTDARTAIASGSQERDALLDGLMRVENYFDEDGTPWAWPEGSNAKTRQERMQFLSTLLPEWRRELFQAILGDTEPTKEDEEDLRFRGVDRPQLEDQVPGAASGVPEAMPGAAASSPG